MHASCRFKRKHGALTKATSSQIILLSRSNHHLCGGALGCHEIELSILPRTITIVLASAIGRPTIRSERGATARSISGRPIPEVAKSVALADHFHVGACAVRGGRASPHNALICALWFTAAGWTCLGAIVIHLECEIT